MLPAVPVGVNPEPVQDVALVDDQVTAEDWPAVMEVGEATMKAVGVGVTAAFTLTVAAAACEVPPAPAQVTE